MASKMIKVDERVHARLAELAAERGTTIGGYVGELADNERTHAEWQAIGQQTETYMREQFGFDPDHQQRARLQAEHEQIMNDLDRQFADRRSGEHRATA